MIDDGNGSLSTVEYAYAYAKSLTGDAAVTPARGPHAPDAVAPARTPQFILSSMLGFFTVSPLMSYTSIVIREWGQRWVSGGR